MLTTFNRVNNSVCVLYYMYDRMMWIAGFVASISSITYPAISAFVSSHASPDQQGVAQGVVTGIRGLCNGIGPALFGVIFFLFGVDLNKDTPQADTDAVLDHTVATTSQHPVSCLLFKQSIVQFKSVWFHVFCS